MESLGLSQKDAQSRNKWRRRIKGQLANSGSSGNRPLRRCVCVVNCCYIIYIGIFADRIQSLQSETVA